MATTSNLSEDLLLLPEAANNNNDASLSNQNLKTVVKAASLVEAASNDDILHLLNRHESCTKASPTDPTLNHPKSPPPCAVPTFVQDVASPSTLSPTHSQPPLEDVLANDSTAKTSEQGNKGTRDMSAFTLRQSPT